MSTTTNHITAEQLWQMGDSPYELLRGELIEVMSPAGSVHGIIMRRLSRIVDEYLEETGQGEAYAGDVGFILSRQPDTVLGPDVAYLSQAKLDKLAGTENFLPTIPDVVFEIVSPHDALKKVNAKANDYLNYGVPLVVVIDPRKRLLHVHRPEADPIDVAVGTAFDCGEAAPGLLIDTDWLFRGLS